MATKAKKLTSPRHFHVPAKERDYLTSNLGLLINAGVPVGEALDSLAQTAKSKVFKQALSQLQQDINDGLPLWKALERSHVVNAQTITLVQLGEQSGNLVENLRVAAEQEEKQRLLRSKVRSAMMYPSFVLSITLVVGIGVAWFLLPQLSETFSQLRVELPAISQVLLGFGQWLRANGIWAVPAFLGGLTLLVYFLFFFPPTRHIGNRLLFTIPGISRLMREIEISRFGYLLGTMLQAGLTVTDALRLLEKASTSVIYKKFYQRLQASFDEGLNFKSSFAADKKSSKLLPPQVQQMIIAGEKSGALPETLRSIGTIYEQKSNISTANLEVIIEPILLIIVWLGVMGVAVAVILPIYSLVGGLNE